MRPYIKLFSLLAVLSKGRQKTILEILLLLEITAKLSFLYQTMNEYTEFWAELYLQAPVKCQP